MKNKIPPPVRMPTKDAGPVAVEHGEKPADLFQAGLLRGSKPPKAPKKR